MRQENLCSPLHLMAGSEVGKEMEETVACMEEGPDPNPQVVELEMIRATVEMSVRGDFGSLNQPHHPTFPETADEGLTSQILSL